MQKCLDNLKIATTSSILNHEIYKLQNFLGIQYISCLLLVVFGNYSIQESESVESQALNNVVMLADLISISLQTDTNGSANFSVSGESISKWLNF